MSISLTARTPVYLSMTVAWGNSVTKYSSLATFTTVQFVSFSIKSEVINSTAIVVVTGYFNSNGS